MEAHNNPHRQYAIGKTSAAPKENRERYSESLRDGEDKMFGSYLSTSSKLQAINEQKYLFNPRLE